MRVSLITAFYKDIEALDLIVKSLQQQDYKDFELVIAEDSNAPETAEYVSGITGIDVKHTTQEDLGIRKARSVNNAILASDGEYLIFIDGDCIPYHDFISSHVKLAEHGKVLSGRRVNLGPEMSAKLRNGTLRANDLEKNFLLFFPKMLSDHATHIGQGLNFSADGFIYKSILKKRKRSNTSLLGCNYSCYRDDMYNIDGYDEAYGDTSVADDMDLEWRFNAYGLEMKSCKQVANVFHLHHEVRTCGRDTAPEVTRMLERKEQGNYKAITGITSHQ